MKVQELRIGSWIHSNVTHADWQIEQQSIELVFQQIDKISPIQLTEEWLLKLGFSDVGNGFFQSPAPSCWNYNLKTNEIILFEDREGYGLDIKVEFVHLLQNLYFALTGKELTYQPRPI